jgi:hypothetical protein
VEGLNWWTNIKNKLRIMLMTITDTLPFILMM